MPKTRHLRKRKPVSEEVVVEEEAEEEGEASSAVRERLADTRLLQRKRGRIGGIDAELLGITDRNTQRGLGPDSDESDDEDGPEILDAYVKAKSMRSTGESEHMDRYVELEMAKRLGKDESSDAYAAGGSMGQGDDELYEIPDSLKSGGPPNVTIPGLMTGITEVQLPIDVRLKNIEDTEAAKKLLLEATGGKCPTTSEEPDQDLPQSFKDTFEPKRSMFAPLFGAQKDKLSNVRGPTDDLVAKRFIRGEKNRWKRGK